MTPRKLLLQAASRFREAGIPDPAEDASLLLSHLTGKPPLSLRLDDETVLPVPILNAFQALAARRLTREPLQYMLNEAPFYGRIFFVQPGVLIPRPETEWLCAWALESLQGLANPDVLDLCAGSGCIGLTVQAERPDARVTLTDLSEDALRVAAGNAAALGLHVGIRRGDLFSAVAGAQFDLILSNPPYIPSAECPALQREVLFEPALALDGGEDGLDFYRRIVREAPSFLRDGGLLMMELGIHQAPAVSALLREEGYTGITLRPDLAGIDRMIRAEYRRNHV